MTTATVTRRLKAEGLPVEMVRGEGYHYFVFDDGQRYQSHTVPVFRFRAYSVEQWAAMGRQFAAMVQAGTYDPFNTII